MNYNGVFGQRASGVNRFEYRVMVLADEWVALGKTSSPDNILKIVSTFYGVSADKMKAKSRKGLAVWSRQVFMYLCLKHTRMSQEMVAGMVNRDHSTAIHARRVVTNMLETNKQARYDLRLIESKLSEI